MGLILYNLCSSLWSSPASNNDGAVKRMTARLGDRAQVRSHIGESGSWDHVMAKDKSRSVAFQG